MFPLAYLGSLRHTSTPRTTHKKHPNDHLMEAIKPFIEAPHRSHEALYGSTLGDASRDPPFNRARYFRNIKVSSITASIPLNSTRTRTDFDSTLNSQNSYQYLYLPQHLHLYLYPLEGSPIYSPFRQPKQQALY